MEFNKKKFLSEIKMNKSWKEKNSEYLKQLQHFLDISENIKDEELKKNIVYQMLKCDFILTELAEEQFCNYFLNGYMHTSF